MTEATTPDTTPAVDFEIVESTEPLLSVESLVKEFPIRGGILGGEIARVQAVSGVSFDLEANETLGIVGESGCGKSTTGRLVLHLIKPTSGAVRFRGKNLSSMSANEMRDLRQQFQIVFQDPYASLNPRKTVGAAISEALHVNRGMSKKEALNRVHELLSLVGLSPEHASRYPHEFSGGQRQRVGIARALVPRAGDDRAR